MLNAQSSVGTWSGLSKYWVPSSHLWSLDFCSGSLGGKIHIFPIGAHESEMARDNVVLITL